MFDELVLRYDDFDLDPLAHLLCALACKILAVCLNTALSMLLVCFSKFIHVKPRCCIVNK